MTEQLHSLGDRPIVITGGCGFIGCNLADRLAAAGHRVVAFDSLSRAGAHENARWLKAQHGERVAIVGGDVRDVIPVTDAVRDAGAVLHLAGQVAVTSSLAAPVDDFEINARGTLNVLEALRLHNPNAPIVFASTNKVYGELTGSADVEQDGQRYRPKSPALRTGASEATALDFYSPYGCSKGTADQYVRDYARVFGLRTVVLRMSCIYGPRQFGTEDQGWVAHFMRRAMNREPVTIYGNGLQVRDVLHVSDAVDAWIGALSRIETVRGQVFNLGGGPTNAISLLELLNRLAAIEGQYPQVTFADWRPGDQPWYVSRIDTLKAALDWEPRIGIEPGLASLHTWIAERFGASNLSRTGVRA
ncbi:CDP-paratose 2-epimerase [Afipia sp. P52-10]|jgi:CDP-paratose 2-epimerase|uniref:SDR family NAD(P)-dependent oxidoreductase n=1 Tax=Afipia sp. P52-10 TaxID=1429916 RepID=UPI0003DF0EA0|nr:SDR family NAD(P)-dependent oxidoreductase [Afipia sp. P52-10]ETR79248.1 CDP-paratose 2-epimerase [Afipia sp. P52-10]